MTGNQKLVYTVASDWRYCGSHISSDCKTITKVEDRKKILNEKRLCFKTTGVECRADECRSKRTCQTCKGKHHSALYKQSNTMMVAIEVSVEYHVVVV